jgi:hypothetical protein
VIESVQPPAKEQVTALSIEVTVGKFFKVAELAKYAHCCLGEALSWK